MASATAGIFGLGKGDAQVLQGNAGLSYLRQAYQQDQLRKQKDDAQFQAELGKISFDGARQADQDKLFEGYNDIRSKFSQLRATQNPLERNKLINQIELNKKQLMQGVNLSKQALTTEQQYAKLRLDRNNDLKDDYGKQYTGLVNTSIFDPEYKSKADYFNDPFHPQYDTTKLIKETEPLVTKVVQGKPYTRLNGGWQQLVRQDKTVADEAIAASILTQKAAQDPSLRRSIMFNYGKNGETPEEATKKFVDAMLPNFSGKNKTEEKVLGSQAPERPDKFYEHQAWLKAHPSAASSADDGRDLFIQQIEKGDELATNSLFSAVNRSGGKVVPNKQGIEIKIPFTRKENVYVLDEDKKPTKEVEKVKTIQDYRSYVIPRDNSDKSKAATNEVLNELQLFKDRRMYVKKDNPYTETKSNTSSMVTVILKNGQQGQIPADKVQAFIKKYPGSKKL